MRKQLRFLTVVVLSSLLSPLPLGDLLLAKEPGSQSGRDRKSEARERQDREASLRNPGLGTPVPKEDQKRIEAVIEKMKEDFRRIQIVRNEMVRNLRAEKPFDYKLISDEVAEINKRADRLKNSLMPGVSGDAEKADRVREELSPEELKNALIKLCNSIDSFVESPVLKNPGTTDVQQLSTAGADLLKVIELSGRIRKSALRLYNNPR